MVGDIIIEDDTEQDIVQRKDGSYIVNGTTHIDDLMVVLDLPGEQMAFNTVAGLVLHHAKYIPKAGYQFSWYGYTIEIIDMDGHKVDKVLFTKGDKGR